MPRLRPACLRMGLILSLAAWGPASVAHEGHDYAEQTPVGVRSPGVAYGVQAMPEGFVLPQARGPRPWSDKPVLNAPGTFRIAIMTDRTGGHRPGVWMDAVRKLNLLRPEFVMSVGDLIEGYTEDRDRLEAEWAEFLGFIDQMQMRFFFVPGNHDVINPVQHQMWREKFGDEWYSFDYRGVHFVCLNSEDTRNQIGREQLAWLTADLAAHAEARWTLVFVHKPLWTYSERAETSGNVDRTNWRRVEQLLADRPHTVFAGHVHHYTQYLRNGGRQYYALATTGGGSRLRGNEYGEFDHVMWLTMEADGPRLAVLRLDGILPPGVVTEESAKRFREFLENARVEVAPILIDNDGGFGEGEINIRLVNELGEPIRATGKIDGLPLRGLSVDPEVIALNVGPTGTAELAMHVAFAEPVDFDRLSRTTLTATVSTEGDSPLRQEVVVPVVIDRRHNCPIAEAPPTIDGRVEPWPEAVYATPEPPVLLGGVTAWKGPADGSFAFHTSHDGERLYFALRVNDERLVEGDRVELMIDGRRVDWRRREPELRRGTCRVSVAAPVAGGDGDSTDSYARWNDRRQNPIEGAEFAVSPTREGYAVEISLPKSVVTYRQGDEWHSYQMAVVQHDLDEPGGEATRVQWRGSPAVEDSNRGYGYFVRAVE